MILEPLQLRLTMDAATRATPSDDGQRAAGPLGILILDDSEDDALLIQEALRAGGLEFSARCVQTKEEFVHALEQERPQVILADYRVPGFDGPCALKLATQLAPQAPVIIVSGTIAEESAVQLLREGAVDYILKDRLSRIAAAVRRALDEARLKMERAEASEALVRRERFFRKLIEGSSDAFFVLDATGRFAYRSESGARLTGYQTDEVLGRGFESYLPPDSAAEARRELAKLLAEPGAETIFELDVLRKSGSIMPMEAHARNLLNDPDVNGIVVTLRDLTQRRQAEAELRDSEHKFRSIAACAQDGVVIMDNDGRIAFWNAAAEQMFGYPAGEAIGQDLHRLLAPTRFADGYTRGMTGFRATGHGGAIGKRTEMAALRKGGEEFAIEVSISAVLLGDRWNAVGVIRDITERKLSERLLRESEEKFRAIFDTTRDGMLVMNIETRCVEGANAAMERLLGYGCGELVGMPISRLHPSGAPIEASEQFSSASPGGLDTIMDMMMARKDGTVLYADVVGATAMIGGKRRMLGAFRDATQRRAVEDTLRAQLKELQRWQDLNLDREGRILDLKS
jgi:PAS domain S-box-containing protein